MTPHPHAEIIKAWADGQQIQVRAEKSKQWIDVQNHSAPAFNTQLQYRVKPQAQLFTQEYHAYRHEEQYVILSEDYPPNLRMTFEAGRLIDAQFIVGE